MNKKYFYVICFLLVFSSCAIHLSHHVKPSSFNTKTNQVLAVNNQKSIPEKIHFKGKLIVTKGSSKQILNINIKSKKDSLIWISARLPIGIEMFRAQITSDSIYFMDRIRKTYFIEHISFFEQINMPDISLTDINTILTGVVKIEADTVYYQKTDKCVFLDREKKYVLNRKNANLLSITRIRNQDFQVYYQDYKEIENQSLPFTIKIYLDKKKSFFASLNYRQISFLEKVMFNSFKIPEDYQYAQK